MQIFRKVDDLPHVAAELNNIGIEQKELGNPDAAKASYTASFELLKQLHDTRQVARAYNNLGGLLLQQNKLYEAEQDFGQAYAIYSGEGQVTRAVLPLHGLAHIAWLRGQLPVAHARYQQAIQICRQVTKPQLEATALRADAHMPHDAGDEISAVKSWNSQKTCTRPTTKRLRWPRRSYRKFYLTLTMESRSRRRLALWSCSSSSIRKSRPKMG